MTPKTLNHHGKTVTYCKTIRRRGKVKQFLYLADDNTPCYLSSLPVEPSYTPKSVLAKYTVMFISLYTYAKKANLFS